MSEILPRHLMHSQHTPKGFSFTHFAQPYSSDIPEQEKMLTPRYPVVTILGLLYMCSLMDRTNVGIAKIAGSDLTPLFIKNVDR
jgi:hypothetical protein